MAKYKDDQLLRNPGGDAYNLQAGTVAGDLEQHRSFSHRIGKDLSDSWDNCKRFLQNLTFGSETAYRDSSGQVRRTRRKGLLGTLGDFLKNTASALSFGLYTPQGESKPSGLMERMLHFVKKSKQALFGDLVQGVPAAPDAGRPAAMAPGAHTTSSSNSGQIGRRLWAGPVSSSRR